MIGANTTEAWKEARIGLINRSTVEFSSLKGLQITLLSFQPFALSRFFNCDLSFYRKSLTFHYGKLKAFVEYCSILLCVFVLALLKNLKFFKE